MSWLVRIEMDTEVAQRQGTMDSYAWHQRLWQCFANDRDQSRDFLTRIDFLEGTLRLWVLCQRKPTCPPWCPEACFALKEVSPSFLGHRYFAFDLRANPIKTLVVRGPEGETLLRPNGKRIHGKRVPLVDPDELKAWLERKALTGGFHLVDQKPLEIGPMSESHFQRKGETGYHGGVQFKGVLEVTDSQIFGETFTSGIGSAKGFGFGMLLLAPINQ